MVPKHLQFNCSRKYRARGAALQRATKEQVWVTACRPVSEGKHYDAMRAEVHAGGLRNL